jgi:peptidoglycan/xylan/chitin deacetylase (PgdA/CDA1 family)
VPFERPPALDSLPEPWSGPRADAAGEGVTDVFLTIDTEDAYFTEPRLMCGEGIGREWGAYGILDVLASFRLTATFFVNVYEADRQPPGVVAGLVKDIVEAGHEVGLHSHPSPALDIYGRPLFRYSVDEQEAILELGCARIEEWCGQRPISFRAGGYALDDATFQAMERVGIEIDSSSFFATPNNHNTPFTVNAVRRRGGVVEVPVTLVARAGPEGDIEQRKLDLDWLSGDELAAAVDHLVRFGVGQAMFMMHSFSFIDKATKPPEEPPSERALFTSDVLFNRYVEVYGPKPDQREKFEAFLDVLTADESVRVRSLAAARDDLRSAAAAARHDIVPLVARSS